MPPPREKSGADPLNAQIADAVRQLNAAVPSAAPAFGAAAAFQVFAHAIALRFQNSVAQQQHDHILRQALTTAATRALLDGRQKEAEAIIKLADARLPVPDLRTEISQLKDALRELHEELVKFTPPPASPAAKPAAPRSTKKPAPKK